MSREWYFRAGGPGEKAAPELLGLDIWFDGEGMQEVYADPAEMSGFDALFSPEPAAAAWQKPAGAWVEW